jgi:hypothetical protein
MGAAALVQSSELVHVATVTHALATHSLVDGFGQSDAVTQATQRPLPTSQTLPSADVAQSVLDLQPADPPHTPLTHALPSSQSTASRHSTHFFAFVSQSCLRALQSISEVHAVVVCVVVLPA